MNENTMTTGAEPLGNSATDPAGHATPWRLELSDFFAKIDRGEYIPIKSNIDFVDDLTGGGFVPGTITMIVADPGAGKTALCQQLAGQFARNGYNVAFINYEMDEGQLFARDLAREVKPPRESALAYDPGITARDILRGDLSPVRRSVPVEKAKRWEAAVEDYQTHISRRLYYNMYVRDEDGNGNFTGDPRPIRNTAGDLRLLTRQLLASYDRKRKAAEAAGEDLAKVHAAILFVDYIQLITTGSDSKINSLEEVTGVLTGYAKAGNTLVFAVSSASKESRRNTQTTKPAKTDDEETGQPSADPGDSEETEEKPRIKPICIYCDKARFGIPEKAAHVQFIGAVGKFISNEAPKFAGEYEKQGYLRKASANGASVLEYSAAYFLSLNDEQRAKEAAKKREKKASVNEAMLSELQKINENTAQTAENLEARAELEAMGKARKRSSKKSSAKKGGTEGDG